jgi:hypothetical protein
MSALSSALVFVFAAAAAAGQPVSAQEPLLNADTFQRFLADGKWTTTAEENVHGERLSADFVRAIVEDYRRRPEDPRAIAALGLVVLGTAVAEWGVQPGDGLPSDPDSSQWRGPALAHGKHVMSYAKGGIGIVHADSGLLSRLFVYLQKNHAGLGPDPTAFFKLRGTNFDVLYANGGHCQRPSTETMNDLNGLPFGHARYGYAGDAYCRRFHTKATNEEDWRVFRHWIRAALRIEDVQRWLVEQWIASFWMESYRKVMAASGGTVEEAMVNARIRNSSTVTAECAIAHARPAADKIKAQLEAYTLSTCRGSPSHKRRFGQMQRPIALYRRFSSPQ